MTGSVPHNVSRVSSDAVSARGGFLGLFSRLPRLAEQGRPPASTPRRILAALAIGCVGGALFAAMGAPLAWMLGSMIFVTVASLSGARLAIPPTLRSVMITVLGVMLGSSFTPELLGQLSLWGGSLVLLLGFLAVTMVLAFAYFYYGIGLGRVTSYFSAAPGGLSEMILLGEANGGDMRVISLMHATRLVIVVALIPFYFRVIEGVEVPTLPPGGVSLLNIGLVDALLLTACAVIGQPVARLLRIPAAALVGPMLLSAAVHLAGWSSVSPPVELIAVAQIVIGTAIGARFSGLAIAQIWPYLLVAVGSGILMVGASVIAAWLFADLLGTSVAALMLALCPGGLAEMALIALSLDIDTAFVSGMHVLRITAVVLLAPLAFALLRNVLPARSGDERLE